MWKIICIPGNIKKHLRIEHLEINLGSLNEKLFFNVEVLRKWGLDGINYKKENNNTLQILHLKFINEIGCRQVLEKQVSR